MTLPKRKFYVPINPKQNTNLKEIDRNKNKTVTIHTNDDNSKIKPRLSDLRHDSVKLSKKVHEYLKTSAKLKQSPDKRRLLVIKKDMEKLASFENDLNYHINNIKDKIMKQRILRESEIENSIPPSILTFYEKLNELKRTTLEALHYKSTLLTFLYILKLNN